MRNFIVLILASFFVFGCGPVDDSDPEAQNDQGGKGGKGDSVKSCGHYGELACKRGPGEFDLACVASSPTCQIGGNKKCYGQKCPHADGSTNIDVNNANNTPKSCGHLRELACKTGPGEFDLACAAVAPTCQLGSDKKCYGQKCPTADNSNPKNNTRNNTNRNNKNNTQGFSHWTPSNTKCAWPNGGAKAAVSITYDDALPSQVSVAAPALEQKGMRGTFFIMDQNYINDFKPLGQKGHDIAGHHADCSNKSTIAPDSVRLIQSLGFWTNKKAFAYPCGNLKLKDSAKKAGFIGARGVRGVINKSGFDRWNINSFSVGHTSLDAMLNHYKNAVGAEGWASYHFHQVNGVALQHHTALLNGLSSNKDVWVAPFSVVLNCAIQAGAAK